MRCDELEQRLNQLLDQRQPLDADPDVAAHTCACPACAETVAAYRAMLAGVEALDPPEPTEAFTTRLLQVRQQRSMRRRVTYALLLATAAAILLAAWPWLAAWKQEATNPPVAQQTPTFPLVPPEVTPQRLQDMFQTTGRGLITLPETFRRVASSPEADRLAGRLRTVTEPVTAAWQVLRSVLPRSTKTTDTVEEAKTGLRWGDPLAIV
jgi:hypothetical protein